MASQPERCSRPLRRARNLSNDLFRQFWRDWPIVGLTPPKLFCYCHLRPNCRRRMAKQRRPVKTAAKPVRRDQTALYTGRKSPRKAIRPGARPRTSAARPAAGARAGPAPSPAAATKARVLRSGRHLRTRSPGAATARLTVAPPDSSARFSSAIPRSASCSSARGFTFECASGKRLASLPTPKTPAERVYAATVALNSGDHAGALDHLQRALGEDPESDHAHYIMAVALGMRNRADEAIEHLRQAIALNPENRASPSRIPTWTASAITTGFETRSTRLPLPNRRRARSPPLNRGRRAPIRAATLARCAWPISTSSSSRPGRERG